MRGDARIGLVILAAGIAPAIIKKSKPMARYLGDQLIRAGEYLKVGSEETVVEPPPKVAHAHAASPAGTPIKTAVVKEPGAKAKAAAKKPAAKKPAAKRSASKRPQPETPPASEAPENA